MCGINGFVSRSSLTEEKITLTLSQMNKEIIHRGPDEDGFLVKKTEDFSVGLAMRRLSIIDLSTGKQPIYSEDGKIAIVFNGEIYNYLQLKELLKTKGTKFHTTSDTEVILRLYEKYGRNSFAMLDGMFAFSIFDEHLEKVFIARDFFGEKPLYFTPEADRILWASELKSITAVLGTKPTIAKKGLSLYFQLTYIPAPFTIYEGIHKLEPNHFLDIDCKSLEVKSIEIEQMLPKNLAHDIDFQKAKELTHDLVNESVESRSVADVPLGTFLSGGVDSSIVSLALAQQREDKINTFSVGFEKKSFDESDKARMVAKLIGSEHHEFIISIKDLQENLDSILLNFDEPFADSSSLPTYLVANKTRQHVKVALTGDGGDEVFGGYNKYYVGRLNNRYTSIVPSFIHEGLKKVILPVLSTKDDVRGKRFQMKKMLNAVNYEGDFYWKIISLGFQEEEARKILQSDQHEEDVLQFYKNKTARLARSLTDFRNIDKIVSLEGDMLVKVDRTSMLTSLESRAPFLNKKIWNFTSQLPENFLIKGWDKKHLLKESFKCYFPPGFLDKSKKGFGVPVGDWLREHLSEELLSYIEPQFLITQNIFETDEIVPVVKRHLSGKEDNTFRVWTFYCFQKWYRSIYLNL